VLYCLDVDLILNRNSPCMQPSLVWSMLTPLEFSLIHKMVFPDTWEVEGKWPEGKVEQLGTDFEAVLYLDQCITSALNTDINGSQCLALP